MSRDDAPGRHRAYRHLLTAARGGFQTVAAAAGLPAALVAQLEQEVGSFALPDGDGGHPSLQLRRWDDDFHLLTRFAPRDGGGDGRRGNYLAESLLVPTAWLAEA
ncbi:MAG TPA: hypothetical protein VHM02_05765, partial [Thermoanaerobaculia bacterium]|nr:hypothetical protein [Thermoanaerobaculia bacterium]